MNAPRKIEWAGPEGWTVWADEDGVHLRSRRGDALEMPDVARLLDLWEEARACVLPGGKIPAPKPPSREELRHLGTDRAEEYARRRAVRAIESEFAPTDTTPF